MSLYLADTMADLTLTLLKRIENLEDRFRQKYEPKKTFTPEDLLALPIARKTNEIEVILDRFVYSVSDAAALGETSYVWEFTEERFQRILSSDRYRGPPITLNDILEATRERFPGCKVEGVEETKVVSGPFLCTNTRVTTQTTKGIRVSWA